MKNNNDLTIAKNEYKRLCELLGRVPYGDCELVALMLHRTIPNSKIVHGDVKCRDGETKHFWIRVDAEDIDPLSEDWEAEIVGRKIISEVDPSKILEDYKKFIAEFPEPCEYTFFPLRWKVKEELLS